MFVLALAALETVLIIVSGSVLWHCTLKSIATSLFRAICCLLLQSQLLLGLLARVYGAPLLRDFQAYVPAIQ